jgi:hypothetical protein
MLQHVTLEVAPEDIERSVALWELLGFEVHAGQAHWGAPRAKVVAPGGHGIELMAFPPPRVED